MNVVTTKMTIIAIEFENNDKKIAVTQKRMLRHNNELKADIYVMTKENYVTTNKATESEISITTEKFYVATENGREVR